MSIIRENTDILDTLCDRADFFASNSISQSTRRAYESDWKVFWTFCDLMGIVSLPAEEQTISAFLAWQADSNLSCSTISRRLSSISAIHRAAGHDSPCTGDRVSRVMQGIRRKKGVRQKQAKAISWKQIQKMARCTGQLIIGLRDASILTLGWAGALRRSEIVALNIGDIEYCDRGIIISIRRSKTDQIGEGEKVAIPYSPGSEHCPIECLQRWLARRSTSPITDPDAPLYTALGAAARGKWFWCNTPERRIRPKVVSDVVKQYSEIIGLNSSLYSAHSLRRGLATDAAAHGVPERILARHTRHASIQILRQYIESGELWTNNPLSAIFSNDSTSSRIKNGELPVR